MPDPVTAAPSARANEPRSFWRSVGEALRSRHHDYTAETLPRAVLLLAVPMVLEMVMESLFAIADVFWVSRLGRDAVAAVGLTESVMYLVYAVSIGIAIAATAIVARRIGEKDPERAAQTAGQTLLIGVAVAATMGAILGSQAGPILRLMGASEAVIATGAGFAHLMLGANITVFLIFLNNAIFRGAGDAVLAMRTLCLANGLNIVLGPCFIFGFGPIPAMGVTGGAVATNLGRGIGVLYQLWHLAGHRSEVRVRLRHLRPVGAELAAIAKTARSGIAQMLINMTSWIGLFKLVSAFGSATVAGYTIAIRIVVFAILPAWGLAGAGATLVGQNLGAGEPTRADAAVTITTRFNLLFMSVVGALYVIAAGPLVRCFTGDPEVLRSGTNALRIISLGFPLYASGMCITAAFNGAGDTWTPTRLNFYCFWVAQMSLAWLLSRPLGFGAPGVFVAEPVCFGLLTLWSLRLFRRGEWKGEKV